MHFWSLFVHPKRDPPRGGGLHGSIRLAPAQTDRRSRLPRDFSGLRPEARLRPRRPLSLPYGLGGSAPSPYAPPRQALCTDPFEHSVEGFCGAARVEWAGPVWAKNRSRRAVTCVSLPPSQRRAPFRGIHKGASPLCVLFTLLFAQAKNKPSARTGPGILCRLRHTSQKGKAPRSCTKRTPARGGFPGKLAGSARSGTV